MSTLHHYLFTQAVNNAWANHRLFNACLNLSDAEFLAPRTGFFPSISATLNHNLTVDWFYTDALERALTGQEPHVRPVAFFEPEVPHPFCPALAEAQRAVDGRGVALCRALRETQLDLPVGIRRRTGMKFETVTRLLAHLFQHQIHHRGQAHAMLSGTSVAPPQLDEFFCANEADLRATELEALGYSEEWIWGSP